MDPFKVLDDGKHSEVENYYGKMEPEEDVEEEIKEEVEEEKPAEDTIKREGDIFATSFHPIDVARDFYKDNVENNDWYIIRRRVNKFNLAAKYSRHAQAITESEIDTSSVTLVAIDDYDFKRFGESDQTYIFTFRHARSAAVPNGRQVEFLAESYS